ncbi:MAG: histone deacetylase [Planctomycetota bacterium]|nr:histone deacetylase [Planctomycetota bacterium]
MSDSTNPRPTAIVYDEFCLRHTPGPGHPERPERAGAIVAALRACPASGRLAWLPPRPATLEELAACHTAHYIRQARHDIESGAGVLSTGDTNVCRDSWSCALLAAGAALTAVDAVCQARAANAFCPMRPPGHHATSGRGMGFCLFNNAALAARYAQRKHRVQRVLIVDWDVHHGNGTQEIFYEDPSVFYFSTHQWPWYPGSGLEGETGAGPGAGATMNRPLPAGAGGKEVLAAFQNDLAPAMKAFRPGLVIVSAGFDSRGADPLGHLRLSDDDFADLTRVVLTIAAEHAAGRLVSVLEGGYNVAGLASAACSHVRALADFPR